MSVTAEELEIIVRGNVQDAINKLEQLRSKMNEQLTKVNQKIQPSMQQASKAVSDYASKSVSKMSIVNKEIDLQQQKVKRLAGEYYNSLKSGKGSTGLLEQYKKAGIQLDKLKLRAQNASESMSNKLAPAVENTGKKTNTFIKTFKRMLLIMAIRKVIQSAIQGFQDMAKYSTSFNQTMSQLQSKFLETRNSIASAFAPVLQGLTPIITTVTNALITLFNWLAKVNTILFTNKTSFTKAKAVTTDYAKSLGKATKEAKGALAPFDELNVITQPETNTQPGMPSPSEMFEEEAIDEETSNKFAGLKAIFEGIYDIGLKLWNNVLKPIASWTGGVIVDVFTKVGTAVGKLFNFLSGKTSFKEFLNDLSFGEALLLAFLTAITLVGGAILAYNAVMAIANTVTAIFSGIMAVLTSPITLVVLAITALIVIIVELYKHWDEIKEAFVRGWEVIANGAKICWENIKSWWADLGEWFNQKVITPIANFFGNMWNGIKSAGSKLADWIKTKVINPVVSAFKTMYNGVMSTVENMINGVIGLINGFLKGLNKIMSKIENMLNSLGIGISLPRIEMIETVEIPRLAKGGVLTKDTIFMGGEYAGASQNPEIVAPQSLMYETNVKANIPVMNALEEGFDKLADILQGMSLHTDIGIDKIRIALDSENKRAGNKLYGGAY